LKSPRGGRPLRWGVRYWHFDPYHTKKVISLSSLSTLKPHILFLLLFLLLALAAASSRWHTVSPSLIFRPSQASRMRFESAAFPSHTGAPILPFQPKSTREFFESNGLHRAVDASEERSPPTPIATTTTRKLVYTQAVKPKRQDSSKES
jgi:hypothetical protein